MFQENEFETRNLQLHSVKSTPLDNNIDHSFVPPISVTEGGQKVVNGLSKNKLRKIRKYEKLVETKKLKRSLVKGVSVTRKKVDQQKETKHRRFRGNDEKLEAADKLRRTLQSDQRRVVIDCQYVSHMSEKEQKRFSQQIRRAYASNRVSDNPLHLYLTSLDEQSEFFKICCKQNSGFSNYVLDRTDKSVVDLFCSSSGVNNNEKPLDDVVYLSPDSDNELLEFCSNKIYIIGGIVDETIIKNLSLQFGRNKGITTARIPVDQYFRRSDSGTFKKILTINQVVDVILEWHKSLNWLKAIGSGLPKRFGFVPIEDS